MFADTQELNTGAATGVIQCECMYSMHLPENMCICMQHVIYYSMCNSRIWIWRGQWWKRRRQCMLLCRSMFSDQPKTSCLFTCERSTECECAWGGACSNCMHVCVWRQARAASGVRGVLARWRLQGQLRDWPLSGQPQHPSNLRLSINKSSMVPRSMGLSAGSTRCYIFSTLLSIGFTGTRRGLIGAKRTDRFAISE